MKKTKKQKKVLLFGKLPPPYMGPSIASEILLKSDFALKNELVFFNTSVHSDINTIGKFRIYSIIRNIVLYISCISTIRRFRPDVAILPISQAQIGMLKDSVFALIALVYSRKLILQLRGGDLDRRLSNANVLVRVYIAWIIRRADAAVVLGESLRYIFEKYLPKNKIYVVPNGGDYLFTGKNKRTGRMQVLTISNIQESKGIRDVLETARMMRKVNREIEFVIAGKWLDGREENYWREVCQREEMNVSIVGAVLGTQQKRSLLESSDVFLFVPREQEGHPWVIIEAMAASKPIIATDKGAIKESVLDGVNGFIVDAYSPGSILEKLEWLFNNSDQMMRMGRRSFEIYISRFTEKHMVENWNSVIHSVSN